ncbi:MAG: hypothetical protein WAZ77_10795 [Candidatus Nitrosopolaris sp.]
MAVVVVPNNTTGLKGGFGYHSTEKVTKHTNIHNKIFSTIT